MAEIRRKKTLHQNKIIILEITQKKNRYKKNINKIPQMDNDCG